jgi:hypothetical protein
MPDCSYPPGLMVPWLIPLWGQQVHDALEGIQSGTVALRTLLPYVKTVVA